MDKHSSAASRSPALQAAEERRATARYACDLQTTCHTISLSRSDNWPTRVLDLSANGIGISSTRRFEVGALLSINLETPDRAVARTLFVRVVNVSPVAGGMWRMGCKLTGELGDEELRVFQAERKRPQEPDYRAWVRSVCDVETLCHQVGEAASEAVLVRVADISAGGMKILARRLFAEGVLLNVELPGDDVPKQHIMVRVVRWQNVEAGLWLFGCEFAELLSDEELGQV